MEFSKPSGVNYFGHVSDQAVPLNASHEPRVIDVETVIENIKGNSNESVHSSSPRAPIDIVCSRQRTVFVVDMDSEMMSAYGNSTRLDVIKRCIKAHVHAVYSAPSVTTELFAIFVVRPNGQTKLHQNFTCDSKNILNAVDRLQLGTGDEVPRRPWNLNATLDVLHSNAPGIFGEKDFLYHVILVHSRSNKCPVFMKPEQRQLDFIMHRQVVVDLVMLHDQLRSEETFQHIQRIHVELCKVIDMGHSASAEHGTGKWPSYVFSGFEDENQMLINFLMLTTHPALRESQSNDPFQFHKKISFGDHL